MRPTDTFDRDIDRALRGTPADQDQADLAYVCACLHHLANRSSRSSQHQQWAWTRLQAQTSRAPSWSDQFSLRWFATGTVAALCLGLVIFWSQPSTSNTPSATIVSKGEKLHAVPFHSKRANADVIWVDGYDYLPASYPLR